MRNKTFLPVLEVVLSLRSWVLPYKFAVMNSNNTIPRCSSHDVPKILCFKALVLPISVHYLTSFRSEWMVNKRDIFWQDKRFMRYKLIVFNFYQLITKSWIFPRSLCSLDLNNRLRRNLNVAMVAEWPL